MPINRLLPFRDANRRAALILSALVLLILALTWLAGRYAETTFVGDLQRQLDGNLDVHTSALVGDVAGFPAELTMLTSDPRILRAVVSGNEEDIGAASERLRRYADLSGAEDALIVTADGEIIVDHEHDPERAAVVVDWLRGTPAFASALNTGLGKAFGVVGDDAERRYAFLRRISNPGRPAALLIITLSLDHTELLWRLAGQDILVVDRQGTILMSADQSRLFEGLGDAPDADSPSAAGRSKACREGAVPTSDDRLCLAHPVERLGWDLYLLGDMAPVRAQVHLVQWVTALAAISLALLIGVVGQRRLAMQRTLRIKEDANRQLQQRVALRTRDLQAANQQLQIEIEERGARERDLREAQAELVQTSKLAALGQLSVGIAHQLNQPLAAVRAYADNARTFLARGQTEAASDNLVLIGDLTERIGKMTKDLKVLGRRQPTRTEPVLLPPLVLSVIDQFNKADADRSVSFVYDRQPAIVLAEPVGLQQVLVNLMQNGVDAMEEADEGRAHVLLVSTFVDAYEVRLSVSDTGTGIDRDIVDNIFDPFFTTKEVGKGLGLGLSLSASMIKEMGGRLSATNREEGGACLTIELKRASEDSSRTEGSAS